MSPTFFPAPDFCICGSLYGMFFPFLLASSSFRSQPHISSSGNLSCPGQLPYHMILQDHVTPICSIYNNLYSDIYLWDYYFLAHTQPCLLDCKVHGGRHSTWFFVLLWLLYPYIWHIVSAQKVFIDYINI